MKTNLPDTLPPLVRVGRVSVLIKGFPADIVVRINLYKFNLYISELVFCRQVVFGRTLNKVVVVLVL